MNDRMYSGNAPWQQANQYLHSGGEYQLNHYQMTYSRQLVTSPVAGDGQERFSNKSFLQNDAESKEFFVNRLIEAADPSSPSECPRLFKSASATEVSNDLSYPPPRATCSANSTPKNGQKKDQKKKKGVQNNNQENCNFLSNRKPRSLLILQDETQSFRKDDDSRRNLRIKIGNSGEKDRTVYILSPTSTDSDDIPSPIQHPYDSTPPQDLMTSVDGLAQSLEQTHINGSNETSPYWKPSFDSQWKGHPFGNNEHHEMKNAWDHPLKFQREWPNY